MSACDGDDGDADTMAGETGSGDGDGDSGDGDTGSSECFEQPEICEQFVRCIGALVPDSAETVEAQYGAEGSCWCNATEEEAQGCYSTCKSEVEKALLSHPTESQCHESVCALDELDPDQPYGPIVDGACSDYISQSGDPIPQEPFMSPLGVSGGFCAPECSGLANACPEHTQTSAQGTCYLNGADASYCVSRCYVDSTVIGGTQCQCGATCQPSGSPDGDGNMRGLCTFE
ncbi:hypothetical protein [Enhygromyxa salina]|uniref:hypothetical protein n=1 Tax=Enhygromyxa salina TaxID=215803 RepID=UPI0011B1E3B2|nr:hypothetical protein [Enhygromyxa salina]